MERTKIDDLVLMMSEFNTKLDNIYTTLNNKLDTLQTNLAEQISDIRSSVSEQLTATNNHLNQTTNRIDSIERQLIRNDVIITGVPFDKGENMFTIINNICEKIGFICPPLGINSFYRLPAGNSVNKPILLKFTTSFLKTDFFNKYMDFGGLSLKHIGFEKDSRIFINHSITQQCSRIRKAAMDLRAKGLLGKITIKNGNVYVCKYGDKTLYKIVSINELNDLNNL